MYAWFKLSGYSALLGIELYDFILDRRYLKLDLALFLGLRNPLYRIIEHF